MYIISIFKKASILSISIYISSLFIVGNSAEAQKSCVITESNNVVCGKLLPNSKTLLVPPKITLPDPIIQKGIRYELKSCLRKGKKDVDCLIKITNLSDKTIFNLYTFPSKIVAMTSEGMQYQAQSRVKGDLWVGSPERASGSNLASKRSLLIKASFIIPETIKQLESLEVGIYTSTGKKDPIQLENVFLE